MARRRHLFLDSLQRILSMGRDRLSLFQGMAKGRSRRFALLLALSLSLCVALPGLSASPTVPPEAIGAPSPSAVSESPRSSQPAPQPLPQPALHAQTWGDQGQQFYDSGQFEQAVSALRQAIQNYQAQGNVVQQAIALRNLALVYHRQGQTAAANQAIAQSLELAQSLDTADRLPVLARVLDVQGQLQLDQGQAEAALVSWEQSSQAYEQAGEPEGMLNSRINQAQALQNLGFYRRAIATLLPAVDTLRAQPDSLLKTVGLRSLGDALQVVGNLNQARTVLQESLSVAQRLRDPAAISAAQFSLGNAARAQGSFNSALRFYQQAESRSPNERDRLRARLNQFSLLVDLNQDALAQTLLPQIETNLDSLPPSQTTLYAQVNLAQNLIRMRSNAPRITATVRGATAETLLPGARGQDAAAPSAPTDPGAANDDPYAEILNEVERGSSDTQPTDPSADPALLGSDAVGDRGTGIGSDGVSPITPDRFERLPAGLQIIPGQPGADLPVEQRSPAEIAQILTTAIQNARALGDRRVESYALGTLGQLYEQQGQWSDAQALTQQALTLAQDSDSPDIAYRWQWQLGRIYKTTADAVPSSSYQEAIAAYSEAVDTLQSLRKDLVAINPEVQLSFQESVEPIHRELVSLLLRDGNTNPEDLEKARKIIESLQLAELDNFFREACLDARSINIDEIDQKAAVMYPILLSDRLEVIVRLPQQALRHYSSPVPQTEIENTVAQLRRTLTTRTSREFLRVSQQVYDWIIRPVATDLAASDVDTLVFVLDGSLRNVPMAVLHDGQSYLVERYSLAVTPGLQLLDPRPLRMRELRVLTAGLSEARQGFTALPNVVQEVEQIQAEFPSQVLLNQSFTANALEQAIATSPGPVVHLATHGKFSSQLEETYILTWDGRININQLSNLLQTTDLGNTGPIELLVLSACQTATGDKLAALGLAGVAVRAGARSTLATLWQVSDEATATLMTRFYDELGTGQVTKAEALRRAQLEVLQIPRFRGHPYYWAPYILVGNWL